MKPVANQKGVSLLEVLAGITLFAIVSSGLAVSTISTIKSNSTSREMTAAAALIHDKLEAIRSLNPSANPADLTTGSHSDPLNPLTPLGVKGGEFTRTWIVTANTPSTRSTMVEVKVTFKGPETRTLSGVTYLCKTSTCS